MAEIAIIHFTNYPKGQSRACMGAVMKYTKRDEKTLWEGQRLVSGINCRPESAYDDFLRTKLLYHKDSGTMFYHMVQSFPAGEEVDPAVAHAAALKLAEYFEGREMLVSTHVDRDHIHTHFLINSVSFENGKKLHISKPELTELRQRNDQVCLEFGLPVFQPQKKTQSKAMSGAEYHAAAKGESWKFRLMNTVDECMKFAHDRQEFIALMRSEGYEIRWIDSRKNITYTTPDGKKCRDDRLHDEKYLKENMEYEFRIRESVITRGTAPAKYAPAAFAGSASYRTELAGTVGGIGSPGPTPGRAESDAGGTGRTVLSRPNTGTDHGFAPGSESHPQIVGTGWEKERAELFTASAPAASAHMGMAHRAGGPAGIGTAMVQLGRALERSGGTAPVSDTTTIRTNSDRKTLRKEREKKIAHGHKEDDHAEEPTWQQTM
ncbi:MAG: relaxase/mobilization nuclease domain-containing protein [Oscillospiraceae bacterium]|nr:relaxase/mobilization nuclease domain-containing protein [Oscillospiraceae bacterium]